ncbi:MAG: MIP family channel protein [Opitutaceae bacterium]
MNAHWRSWVVGEFFGTFLLVFFGCGSVAAAVLTGAQVGIFQVAIVWGLGIAIAIYVSGALSGAHLNPAVTFALVVWGGFPLRRASGYVLVQLIAAFVAAALLHAVFAGPLVYFEASHQIQRGAPGSEASAMIFGEFFSNPAGRPLNPALRAVVNSAEAFLVEAVGTALLVLVIFAVTDVRNSARPRVLTALTVGLTVTLLISLLAPLTQAGFNPARDLGPRIWSATFGGWGSVPFTANGSGWWLVYVVAPIVGGQVGGMIYRLFLKPAYAAEKGGIDDPAG